MIEIQSPKIVQISDDESRNSDNMTNENFRFSHEEVSSSSISGSDDIKHESVSLDQLFKEEVLSPVSIKEAAESKPGWPLLRCAVSLTQNNFKESEEARKMSVVQWVMSLPNRTSTSVPETHIGFDSDKSENQFMRDCKNTINKNNLEAWGELPKEMELLVRTTSSNCRWFSHQELKNATSQFSTGSTLSLSLPLSTFY